MSRLIAEISLGARLAFSGGRRDWIRTTLAAVGVAIGAMALLLGASVPVMLDAREARTEARGDQPPNATVVPAGRTVVVAEVTSQWGSSVVRGRLIWPEAPEAPLPPGVGAFPEDHQMYASPALQEALAGPGGDDLRRQMPYELVGTIAPDGLAGPQELAYYAGSQRVQGQVGTGSWRVDRFGYPPIVETADVSTYLLTISLLVTLLLPVAVLIGAALRFGADTRDRRLAAIRLLGADRRAVLRIASGESLVPAGLGLTLGTALYLLARSGAADLGLFDVSVYPSDIHPRPLLAVLAVGAVLMLSAASALFSFRGVAVEPLGVFRRSQTWHGRLWWRLLPVAGSLALLYPVLLGGAIGEDRAGVGVFMLVAAVIPLLPYLMPVAAAVLPGGPASWQLASQQLRRNPTGSTRAVTGIVIAVAGSIALHSFFAAAAVRRATPDDPADPAFVVQAKGRQTPTEMRARTAMFERVDGVRAGTIARYLLYDNMPGALPGYLVVGDCTALRQIATLDRCGDGDSFVVGSVGHSVTLDEGHLEPAPGAKVAVPRDPRPATLIGTDSQNSGQTVLMTPAAAPASLSGVEPWFVETRIFSSATPAAVARRVRGVAAEVDPVAQFTALAPEADKYAPFRTALSLGMVAILLMMGIGLLLDVADRLHERRRLLGVLAAVGARRSTVIWSVLLQAIVPVLAGLALATGVGVVLGMLLMRMSQVPVMLNATAILTPTAVGASLVLLTTMAVLLPAVRRATRIEELRYE
jgi:hypothetical protein